MSGPSSPSNRPSTTEGGSDANIEALMERCLKAVAEECAAWRLDNAVSSAIYHALKGTFRSFLELNRMERGRD